MPHISLRTAAKPQPPMSPTHDPRQNHLLAALSTEDFERVSSNLKLVPLELGSVLYESGSRQRAVYFPTTSIVSLLYTLADGASAEIAVVGNESLIGVSLFMGGETRSEERRVGKEGRSR